MEEDDADGEESESDKEGVPSGDERCEEDQAREEADVAPDFPFLSQRGCLARGIASLEMVDLEHVFEFRALVMKSVPKFVRGAFRGALKISLEEIRKGQSGRMWPVGVHLLLHRTLLSRPHERRAHSSGKGWKNDWQRPTQANCRTGTGQKQ